MTELPSALGLDSGNPASAPRTFDLDALNTQFDQAHPRDILRWSTENLSHLVQVTSFADSGMVILDLLDQLGAQLPVLFIDTLHHFPETLAHVERVRQHYRLDLHIAHPEPSDRKAFEARYGERLWEQDLEQYQVVTKVLPFKQALADLQVKAWINGRRRDQATTRTQLPVFEWHGERLKVNPLVHWTKKEVWNYLLEHNVPYNPLHDQGYSSIGDQPLTTAVQVGEDERAGRWRGMGKVECGIHVL
ncbi:phosphoadenosine phosphosulfate reductase [Leptolyngbya sp. FACHB-261]|uniref:phosphoadenosine phosphosulfate reductase n=1 Tax=Leptolyngbya sp. FACHB-261 TaxID=2692806 RepID=UPI00168656A4|nr:phosphoadenosine phosphosulfate reductase [Leptolyngbya sp. FACHB-261]MBD2099707.1 phosphoadenosine phosphosulfate reductase [Leptolyngbya sp. FACHB-261]